MDPIMSVLALTTVRRAKLQAGVGHQPAAHGAAAGVPGCCRRAGQEAGTLSETFPQQLVPHWSLWLTAPASLQKILSGLFYCM